MIFAIIIMMIIIITIGRVKYGDELDIMLDGGLVFLGRGSYDWQQSGCLRLVMIFAMIIV